MAQSNKKVGLTQSKWDAPTCWVSDVDHPNKLGHSSKNGVSPKGNRSNLLTGERVQIRPMKETDLEGDTEWARMDAEDLRNRYWKAQGDSQQGLFVILNENGERIGRIEYVMYRPAERRTQCNIFLQELLVMVLEKNKIGEKE